MLEQPPEDDVRLILTEAGIEVHLEHAVSLWYYDLAGPVRILHRKIKYGEGYRLGRMVGRAIAQRLRLVSNTGPKSFPDLIVPVPVHPIRALERGFNQSEALADGIGAELGVEVSPDTLRRTNLMSSQIQLNRAERMKNLSGAFMAAKSDSLSELHILLVDDVITTGATMLAAINILLKCSVNRCSVASMAMVRPT